MAVESFYFSHDYSARNDPKLQKVLMKLGQAGKGVYWDLIEMLYEEGGYLLLEECESYAFALRTDTKCIAQLINDFDLFQNDGKKFWSDSVLKRLFLREEKSKKAAKSASIRWKKHKHDANASESDANALRPQYDSNAIKEKKGKDIKEKDNKEENNKGKKDLPSPLLELENLISKNKKPASPLDKTFSDFLEMRKKIKKPATDVAVDLLKNKLEKLSNGDDDLKIKILEQSIVSSWQDIFPLKINYSNQHGNNQKLKPNGTEPSKNITSYGKL